MSSNNDVVTPSEHLTGRVKWFNNKAGFGFISVTDSDRSGSEIFVHHSALEVENQQYKYLVQGEYVEFDLTKSSGNEHEWQAASVHGIKGGKLMCETRRDFKLARTVYKSAKDPEEVSEPRQQRVPTEHRVDSQRVRQPRARGEGPREISQKEEDKEWTLAKTSRNASKKPRGKKVTEESK
jgi:cold shock CspA family protein